MIHDEKVKLAHYAAQSALPLVRYDLVEAYARVFDVVLKKINEATDTTNEEKQSNG